MISQAGKVKTRDPHTLWFEVKRCLNCNSLSIKRLPQICTPDVVNDCLRASRLCFISKDDTGNPLTFWHIRHFVNMASLADVGWKLLEFKSRSKRSGLTHYSAWHRTVWGAGLCFVVPLLVWDCLLVKPLNTGGIWPFSLSTAVQDKHERSEV